jgi:hypothetical protein
MTVNQLEKELIAHFGPLGATQRAYEDYLGVAHGTLPQTLEYIVVPGTTRRRYCPKAVAAFVCRGRVIGWQAEAQQLHVVTEEGKR